MSYIRWFHEINAQDVDTVGGKAANLGEMVSAQLPIPPGFCLTAQAYRDFIDQTGLLEPIQLTIAGMRQDDVLEVEAEAFKIRSLITEQQIPDALAHSVIQGYRRLCLEISDKEDSSVPVAVRSSATAEDLPSASFAGQQDTYLNVRGEKQLLDKVKECWASLWTARAVSYRSKQDFDHMSVYLAVIVQTMIPSDIAGIMFTANPISGNKKETIINASWGLGEAIVSGLVSPDTIVIDKQSGNVISEQIANKSRMITYAEVDGTMEVETDKEMRNAPALSESRLSTLVQLGQNIEAHYGSPQDIEWAHYQGQFYVLQSRPITTLRSDATISVDGMEYNRTMFIEIFPDALSPAFLSAIVSLFDSMLGFTFEALGFKSPQDMEAAKGFYNQPYFNRSYIEAAFKPLPASIREPLVNQITNPFGQHAKGSSFDLSPAYLRMVARMIRFMTRFPKQLPDLIEHYRNEVSAVNSLPLEDVSDVQIMQHINELVFGIASRLLNYDFLMIAVIGRAYRLLNTILARSFGEEADELCARLITGVTGNITMETNKKMWDLAQKGKASPIVCNLLRMDNKHEFRTHLAIFSEGQSFLQELDGFLMEYGHREVRMDILYPTWVEDPTPVLSFVRAYLDADETRSPHIQQERLVKERRALTEEVLATIEEDIIGRLLVSPLFRWLLKHTQIHTRERDTMHFELTRLFPPFRRLLLELGKRRVKQGFLSHQEDVFFLTLDELTEFAETPQYVMDKVQDHRQEFEANNSRPWPDVIRDGQEIYLDPPTSIETADGSMKGIAGSSGLVTGIARVIRGPEEFEQLLKGEILVAPLTNPVWTPLFAIASGVITEVGGILSHGAIVAREYGIPAVMCIPDATNKIKDGQKITVDGNRGIVKVEEKG